MKKEPKIKAPKPPKKKVDSSITKYIVSKYVFKSEINWPRDIKMAQPLVALYPEFEFWEMLTCSKQLTSLAGLITPKAKEYLMGEYAKFNLVLPEKIEHPLEKEKVGEDRVFEKPLRQSIFNFCK